MKTAVIANKKIYEPGPLKAALEGAGFAVVNVAAKATPPTVYVYLEDAEMKDPTSVVVAHQNPAKVKLTSNKSVGMGGVPEAQANGADVHTLTVQKVNRDTGLVVPGSEQLQVLPSQFVGVSPSKPVLSSGQAVVTIGPSLAVGEVVVRVCDPAGGVVEESIRLRFA